MTDAVSEADARRGIGTRIRRGTGTDVMKHRR